MAQTRPQVLLLTQPGAPAPARTVVTRPQAQPLTRPGDLALARTVVTPLQVPPLTRPGAPVLAHTAPDLMALHQRAPMLSLSQHPPQLGTHPGVATVRPAALLLMP